MATITVLKENVPHGPFTRAEVAEKLSHGEITLDSLAFVEGLSQWTPLRDVLAKVDAEMAPPAQPAPKPPVATMPIGTGFTMEQKPATISPSQPIGAGYSYAATMRPPEHLVYAGFWLRFAAYFIDIILLNLVAIVIGLGIGIVTGVVVGLVDHDALQTVTTILQCVMFVFILALVWIYFAAMESSKYQATLGKMALGLCVTGRQGNRIGFGRATGRFFGKFVSGAIFLIGYMMAGWTERKQALHDMLADTLVVRKQRA
jgi:uncharacterized RDD family membrane protein YckC